MMRKKVFFVLLIAISLMLRAEDTDKKVKELQEKLEELTLEIEIMKATSGGASTEAKEDKFKLFGYFGARYMDMNFDDASMMPSSTRITDKPSFMQNNLNIYFQFNPVENWKVLSEIRFLYYPKGTSLSTNPDATTADVLKTNKFLFDNRMIDGNGAFIFNNGSSWVELSSGNVAVPVGSNGNPAIAGALTQHPIATGQYFDIATNQVVTTPTATSSPILLEAGTFVPIDAAGNYIISTGSGYIRVNDAMYVDTQGFIIPDLNNVAYASDITLIASPVVKSVSMFDKEFPTSALDPVSAINYSWGGLTIERAYMEWNYSDKLSFRAGKFLTPFGIWNVDHGLPVLLSARIPYMLSFIPDTQTGIETYGRIYLPHTDLEYNIYISNGRDLPNPLFDNNLEKSVGGRLNLKLQSDIFKELAIGGSGYYGKHTEYVPEYKVVFDANDFIINQNGVTNNGDFSTTKLQVEQHIWSEFDEMDLGVDFKMN